MLTKWTRNRWPLALLAVVTLVAGCSPQEARPSSAKPSLHVQRSVPTSRSALSAFLAGRMAQARGDTRAAAGFFATALKYDPDNTELLQSAFSLMVTEGQLDQAAPLAERIVAFDADQPVPLLVLALRDMKAGTFDQAEKHIVDLPKRGVNTVLSSMLLAWAQAGQGRTDAALETLMPLAHAGGLAQVHAFHAALINDLAGRNDAAAPLYEQALGSQLPLRAVEAAGNFYQRTGRMADAEALYARYMVEHPETQMFDSPYLLKQGPNAPRMVDGAATGMAQALFDVASLMRQGNANDGAFLFARLTLGAQPDFPLAQMLVADLLAGQGHLDDANAMYRSINPKSPIYGLGMLRVAMNLDAANDVDGSLRALVPLTHTPSLALEAYVTRGDVLRRHKRFAEAVDAYDQALKRLPKLESRHWPLIYSRGISYERSGQWDKAETDLLKALELQPDQPDVLNYLGYSWVDQGIHLDRARKMIEKAVELRPNDGAIVDSLGWALFRMGDFANAVKVLEHAVELRPEDPTINDHLGDALWRVGRADEAMFQWKRAIGLDPEPEQVGPLKLKIDSGRLPDLPGSGESTTP